jgi:hypothetical protein
MAFGTQENFIVAKTGVFPSAANQAQDVAVIVNNNSKDMESVCGYSGLIFYVLDSVSMRPWFNAGVLAAGVGLEVIRFALLPVNFSSSLI